MLSGGNYISVDDENHSINANLSAGTGIKLSNVDNVCKIYADLSSISSSLNLSNYSLTSSLSIFST